MAGGDFPVWCSLQILPNIAVKTDCCVLIWIGNLLKFNVFPDIPK
jgi:hypothetical protein